MTPEFITPGEIAALTRIPRPTVYRMIKDGRIPGGYQFAPHTNTGLRVVKAEFEAWFASCRIRHVGRPLAKD